MAPHSFPSKPLLRSHTHPLIFSMLWGWERRSNAALLRCAPRMRLVNQKRQWGSDVVLISHIFYTVVHFLHLVIMTKEVKRSSISDLYVVTAVDVCLYELRWGYRHFLWEMWFLLTFRCCKHNHRYTQTPLRCSGLRFYAPGHFIHSLTFLLRDCCWENPNTTLFRGF